MRQSRIDPNQNGTAPGVETDSIIAKGEAQVEVRVKAHNPRPVDHVSDSRIRAVNADLDKFRHLFGPKRRGM